MGEANRPRTKSRLALVDLLLTAISDNVAAIQRLLNQTQAELATLVVREEDASARTEEIDRLRREAEQLRDALASISTIERAKGILMQQNRISAGQAAALLEAESRRGRRKVADVAASVTDTASRAPEDATVVPGSPDGPAPRAGAAGPP